MDKDLERIKDLREQSKILLEKLMKASNLYPVTDDDLYKATVPNSPTRIQIPEREIQRDNQSKKKSAAKKKFTPLLPDNDKPQPKAVHKPTLDQIKDSLSRDDRYYENIHSFRKMHPHLFFKYTLKDLEPSVDPDGIYTGRKHDYHLRKIEELEEMNRKDSNFIYNGFLQVKTRDCDLVQTDSYAPTLIAPKHPLDPEFPPVKVLIPHSCIEKLPNEYKPHRRNSFDPRDSIDIKQYTMRGYGKYWFQKHSLKPQNIALRERQQQQVLQ